MISLEIEKVTYFNNSFESYEYDANKTKVIDRFGNITKISEFSSMRAVFLSFLWVDDMLSLS